MACSKVLLLFIVLTVANGSVTWYRTAQNTQDRMKLQNPLNFSGNFPFDTEITVNRCSPTICRMQNHVFCNCKLTNASNVMYSIGFVKCILVSFIGQ